MVVVTCAILLALGAVSASAENFNYANDSTTCNARPCPQTNKSFYRYYDANLPSSYESATTATHTDSFSNVPGWNSYLTSSHDESDVHYLRDDSISANVAGVYSCSTQVNNNQQCSHGHVRYNTRYSSWGSTRKKALACHETAHSVGLFHPEDDSLGAEDTRGCVATVHLFEGTPYPYLGDHNIYHLRYSNPY